MTLSLAISEQLRTAMESLNVGGKYKLEAIIDDKVSVSYKYKGYKYLLTLQQYPYER